MVDFLSIPILSRPCQRLARWALCLLCGLVCLSSFGDVYGADDERAKRVLIISTGGRFAPGFSFAEQSALDTLRQLGSEQLEFYSESLDIVRFSNESYHRLFRNYLSEKYVDNRPDLVILIYLGNLSLAQKLLKELFPGVPVVVMGLTEEEISVGQLGAHVSGLAQRSDPRGTIELIRHLQPETRRIVVIGGTAEVDTQVIRRAQEAARALTGRIEFDFWTNRPMTAIRNAVRSLPPQSAILFTRMFRDGAGRPFNSVQAAQLIAESANVPVYVMTDTMLGTGAVGGSVADVAALARRVGEMAKQILDGAPPASLSFEIRTEGVPIFDWRALQRWGISESRLPPNSIIRFRPPSMWEQYRWYIIGSLLLILLQAVLITGLVLNRIRRRRAEGKLRESQELMEMATNAGGLGLWARDLKGDTVWANSVLRSLVGVGQNEPFRAGDILARIHPDDGARVKSDVQTAQDANLLFEGEFRTRLPDGRERWVLAKGGTVNGLSGRGARRMGVVLDITERKKMEEELRESEKRFRMMADTAPVMIWMSGPERLCTFFNKGWLHFTGRPMEQELGNGWAEGVHREDLDRCLAFYADSFKARQEFSMEYRLRRSDGEYCWVLDHGVPRFESDGTFLGYIGTAIDVTELKRSEETLENQRAFLRQVIDIDPNFIFAKDREGRFTLVNQAVADAYGTTVDGLIGKTDAEFNPNRDEVERFHRMDLEVIDSLQERFIAEEYLTDAQGKIRWLQTVKRPIVGKDGVADQVLGASTEITRRKAAEAELRQQRDEFAHLTRVSTMGELAASLAHELNQPLTAILSNAQAAQRFLAANPSDIAEVKEILRDIVEDDNRAGDVIRRLRAFVKKDEISFASLELPSVLREVVSLVHSDATLRNIGVSLETNNGLPRVLGDKVQLQQVVVNLLLNAFEAMKDCPERERQVLVRAEIDSDRLVKVAIKDRGSGLTTDTLDKVFQPFFTTKRDGLGMGLAISRSIIEAHGGRLWAEKNTDRGATFHFTIPITKDESPPIANG